MHRRRFVSLVGAGLLGGIAGCSRGGEKSERTGVRPVRIRITNEDDVPHEGEITLFRDGESVFRDTWSLEAIEHDIVDDRTIEPPAYEPKIGDWDVDFRVISNSNEDEIDLNSISSAARTNHCVWPMISVLDGGDITAAASFIHDTCPLETTTGE